MIKKAAQRLGEAAAAVRGVRVYPDIGPGVSPPAVVIGPPALTWEALPGCGGEPTSGRYPVYVVVGDDPDRALPQLLDLVLAVAAALDAVDDAVVGRAEPTLYPSSGADLPAYQIQVDMALGGD
ncbi:hypothetical protein C1I95_21765 [Micromonospora craterilacus]|uniref:DUF3168 domain-containing protein n=1 Tax=Micromonospora craterilacus TaxID=1655439 RepID=A0A2W2DR36_9ACTN|nr:hypothetical protein C1I95_21765 [Micromonospora craterilacus]